MTWSNASRILQALRRVVAVACGLLFCAVAGCHSTTFGTILGNAGAPQRAVLGAPVNADVQQAFAQVAIAGNDADLPDLPDLLETGAEQVIDLATAFARAGLDNPTIALADEAVRASLAGQMQARALLFPTLNAGANVRVHRGNLLSGRGIITDVDLQSLYGGFGANAKGGGTVTVPGLRLVSHLADAYYAPKAARQKVVQTRYDAVTTRQYTLLEVGVRYLALAAAQARLQAYRQSLKEIGEIERLTTNFAKNGQGRDSDAQRARSEALLLRAEAQRAQEELGSAAAELARLLDLDPALNLRAADLAPPRYELVDRLWSLPQLLEQALTAHPEIVARSAEVEFQAIRLRQERARPWLPVIAIGFSAGQFGGGSTTTTSSFGNFNGRTDLDVAAIWSLQNLGVGNRSTQNVVRSNLESAWIERNRLLERIRQEVAEAFALTQMRRQEVELARRRVETSQRSLQEDLTRIKNVEGRPIEVLSSANQLVAARQDFIRALTGYSQAQLQLYVALGNAPDQKMGP